MATELATAYVSIVAEASDIAPGVDRALTRADRHVDSFGARTRAKLARAFGRGGEDGASALGRAGARGGERSGTTAGKAFSRTFGFHTSKAIPEAAGRAGRKAGTASASGFEKSFSSKASGMGKRLVAPIAAAFASLQVGGFLKDAIEEASDFSENANKITATFGTADKTVQAFAADAANKLGQSSNQALDAAATFGTFGGAAGLSGEKLAKFSTDFVSLASDMASFNNTTPEQAIMAIGAALRGESEPIRNYGVLLDDATLRQSALKLGIIKTTKKALTPQQKVLAAQAEIYKQTKAAQGDFTKTSDGLANSQRIVAGQFAKVKQTLGTALLPTATKFFDYLKVTGMPTAQRLADRGAELIPIWGDKLARGFKKVKQEIPPLIDKGKELWGAFKEGMGDVDFSDVTSSLKDVKGASTDLKPVAEKVGEAFGFVARNSDKLAYVLPVLAGGFLAVKGAQELNKLAGRDSALGMVLQIGSNLALAGSNRQLAASYAQLSGAQAVNTGATNAGFFARLRQTGATLAQRAATIASSIATKAAAAGQWLLNAAMSANPLGLVVLALVGLGAATVIAYKKSETFRKIVDAGFRIVKKSALGMWEHGIKPAASWAGKAFTDLGKKGVNLWRNHLKPSFSSAKTGAVKMKDGVVKAFNFVGDKIKWAKDKANDFKTGWSKALDGAKSFTTSTVDAMGRKFAELREKASAPVRFVVNKAINPVIRGYNRVNDLYSGKDIPEIRLAAGGKVPGWSPNDVADNIPALLTAGEYVLPVKATKMLARQFGASGLEQLRRGELPTFGDPIPEWGKRPKYAAGGPVAAQAWLMGQRGKPYVWGAVGPGGYDCSGLVSAVINVARGQYPHSRLFATAMTPGGFSPGPGLITIGIDRPGEKGRSIGHTAINVAGLRGESRGGGVGVLVGPSARSVTSFNHLYHMSSLGGVGGQVPSGGWSALLEAFTNPGQWLRNKVEGVLGQASATPLGKMGVGMVNKMIDGLTDKIKGSFSFGFADGGLVTKPPTLFDEGGLLQPGYTLAYNATGKPERVVTADQNDVLERLADYLDGGTGGPVVGSVQITESHDGAAFARDLVTELARLRRQGAYA